MADPDALVALLRPERARGVTRRATWFTLLGLVLVPLTIGGLLTWALWQPTQHLDRITGAVVNLDEPVTLNGQTVPLGRQLTAGLVTSAAPAPAGSPGSAATPAPSASATTTANVAGHDSSTNLTWVITDAADAAAGLRDGAYATVVTIPANFSAAATSTGSDPADPQRATIDIAVSERARMVDPAITQAVTGTAIRVLGRQLTTAYLENVMVAFSTLHTSLSEAADGASSLAAGATGVSSGAQELAAGAARLAAGTTTLTSGVDQLSGGAVQVGSGATSLAAGASSLASGVGQVATGSSSLSSGATSLSSGVGQVAAGTAALAANLDTLAAEVAASARVATEAVPEAQAFAAGMAALDAGVNTGTPTTPPLAAGVAQAAAGAAGLEAGLDAFLDGAAQLVTDCAAQLPGACAQLGAAVAAQQDATSSTSLAYGAASLRAGLAGLDTAVNTDTVTQPGLATSAHQLAVGGRSLVDGVESSATGLATLRGYLSEAASGAHQLDTGAQQASSGASSVSSGASQLDTGAQQALAGASALAGGASQLADGANELAPGAAQVANGAAQIGDGVTGLADGATQLADGAEQLSGGATSLSDGLATAVGQLPNLTTEEAASLADVVADPVTATGDAELFGSRSVPPLLVVALWLGALATFLLITAIPARALGSTRSSVSLTTLTFLPGAVVGAIQGVALTAIMAGALDLSPGRWIALAVISAAVGTAFGAVNLGLVALLRGIGRFAAVVVAVVGLACVIVSTTPPLLDQAFALTPVAPALSLVQAVVTGHGGLIGPVLQLLAWAVAGLGATAAAIARHRVVPAGQLARWARAA